MPTHLSYPPAHHAYFHQPIMPNTPGWSGCIYSPTNELSYHPSHHAPYHHPHHYTPTHPMNPPTTNPTTTHPMNPPKYMYSDRVTLWICSMGGWVGVHKIKYFNIVTVHGWVSICTHSMIPLTPTPPPPTSPHTHPAHEPSNHPPYHHPPHEPFNHPITTHLPPH